MTKLCIQGGTIIHPDTQTETISDIYIAAGKIIALGQAPAGFVAEQVISATNKLVLPGLIDIDARLCGSEDEFEINLASELHAAASGGISTVCCAPDVMTLIDSPDIAKQIIRDAKAINSTRLFPIAALSKQLAGKQITPIAALQKAQCIGFSHTDKPFVNLQMMQRCFAYAANFDALVILNPQDQSLAGNGCMHAGEISTRLGLPGIPEVAETVAIAQAVLIAADTGTRLHFSKISTARGLDIIQQAQAKGYPVSASVSVHQLYLTEMDVLDFNSQCHLQPPLRSQADKLALLTGVQDGSISSICSDHCPHERDAKLAPFPETATGMTAFETLLSLAYRLVLDGYLSLADMIARLCTTPAKLLKLESGQLAVGKVADICIFDPQRQWTLDNPEQLVSQGCNTGFKGWQFQGKVDKTLIAGKIVYPDKPNKAFK